MHKIAFVLACTACTGHGRRTQSPLEQRSREFAEKEPLESNTQDALGALLTALNPSAAFNPSNMGSRLPAGNSALYNSRPEVIDRQKHLQHRVPVTSMSVEVQEAADATKTGELSPERYVATNRFFVQDGKGPKFEQRWATRKSRLAELPGFNSFALLRRVDPVKDEPNYVSFTVWDDNDAFMAWRKGSAFKEAHGGGTLWGFLQAILVNSRILKGPPKPAFYDGLLPIAPPVENMPESVDGWRNVPADGINNLDGEVFVAQNRFKITPGSEDAFEQRWKKRESKLQECDGFVAFYMLRRDKSQSLDDGYNYVSTTVWRDRAAFDAWRGQQSSSHGKGPADSKGPPPQSLFKEPPAVALYEGILSLYAPDYNSKHA